MQIDEFVFSTLLMWLQEDGVFTDLAASGPAAATETSDNTGSPSPPAAASQSPSVNGRLTPRKVLQG